MLPGRIRCCAGSGCWVPHREERCGGAKGKERAQAESPDAICVLATSARTEYANSLRPMMTAYGSTFTANLIPASTTNVCSNMRTCVLETFMGDADAKSEEEING